MMNTFSSFFVAGFECTAALGADQRRLNLLSATKHDDYCRSDYRLIKALGISTVREGLSWNQIDQGQGCYNFSRFERMMQIALEADIQQIWDLNHFDYPEYLGPFSDEFVTQFAEYARQAIRVIRRYQTGTVYIVPINEISFFAWIAGEMGHWSPYTLGNEQGFALKKQLVKASITAMDAIWDEDQDVRFIHPDPFMRRLATAPATRQASEHVKGFNNVIRFQAWDMLAGKVCPELGGDPKYLDIVGVNYYVHNQEWVHTGENGKLQFQMMDWDSADRISFAEMLSQIYRRYRRPMFVSETGSFGENRQQWWRRTLQEIDDGLQQGLPLIGVCSYPTLDRPDDAGFLLPNSGLWDFASNNKVCKRIPHQESLDVVQEFIKKWEIDRARMPV